MGASGLQRVWRIRSLVAAFILALSSFGAAAQMCPAPYAEAASAQTGPVCASTCAGGTFAQLSGGNLTCTPGVAPATCPEPGSVLVMGPNGPTCVPGYTPIAAAGQNYACRPGDVRVERPPYLLDGKVAYEACFAGSACPQGYLMTEDPDGALGSTKVCMLPCQDFVMNQGMACSCGSGGQLGAETPGGPVQQICKPICGAGTRWQSASPLYAFKAEEGTCMPTRPGAISCAAGSEPQGGVCVAVAPPACPPSMYWSGQVCLPIGTDAPILIVSGCPPATHWNGSHCVPDYIVPPICAPGMHWSGFFCVPNGPICPPFMFWNGNQCVPFVQPPCPLGQHWNGAQCVPNKPICPPNMHWNGFTCVPNLQPVCPPGQHWDNAAKKCVPNFIPPKVCPPKQHWDAGAKKCVPDPLPPPKLCPPKQHWDAGLNKCVPNVLPPPKFCPPKQHWDAGLNKCVPNVLPPPKLCPPKQHWDA
ncbi:MAG TPA: hypothetical protein VGQ97_10035, partial [Xanthobacteraceae bacterium]|nr:hypothetical protein [Xanthobacteraceae bacterium]